MMIYCLLITHDINQIYTGIIRGNTTKYCHRCHSLREMITFRSRSIGWSVSADNQDFSKKLVINKVRLAPSAPRQACLFFCVRALLAKWLRAITPLASNALASCARFAYTLATLCNAAGSHFTPRLRGLLLSLHLARLTKLLLYCYGSALLHLLTKLQQLLQARKNTRTVQRWQYVKVSPQRFGCGLPPRSTYGV